LLGAGLVFVPGIPAWAADPKLGAPGALVQLPSENQAASFAPAKTRSDLRSDGTEGERGGPPASAAPPVEVRVGDHGEFERVAFEWPEPVEHEVVRQGDELIVAFSRPGRIDVSRIADRLRKVVDAWADNDGATARITLRLLPNARVRSLNLKDGRVAIDVFDGTARPIPALSPPGAEPDAIQELRQALEQRDAAIAGLLARVEQLERIVALSGADLDRVTGGRAMATPSVGHVPPPRLSSPPGAVIPAPSSELSTASRVAPPNSAPPAQPSATASQGQEAENPDAYPRRESAQSQTTEPGQVEVDEEAVERALDFTLVQEGALLLPFGRAEFTPSFTYTRREDDFPVVLGPPGNQVIAEQELRRNEFELAASLLVGLPLDAQLELGLPYNLVDQSAANRVLGIEVEESSDTGHGLGDFSVGLAKTVLRERNWWPDVVLRVNWDTGSGDRSDNDVALDGGFQELAGSISLLKRQDPLVFAGAVSYEAAFEEHDFDPGDTLGFSVGAFLAASPATSLRVVLNQSFIDEFKADGRSIDGSDRVESVLSFGASAILGRNTLLDLVVGAGLTDDSADYAVAVSLPIRFSTPGL
jgi:hypothetical protein